MVSLWVFSENWERISKSWRIRSPQLSTYYLVLNFLDKLEGQRLQGGTEGVE